MFWTNISLYAAKLGMDATMVKLCARTIACSVCLVVMVVFVQPLLVMGSDGALMSGMFLRVAYWAVWVGLSIYGTYIWLCLLGCFVKLLLDLVESTDKE